MTIDFEKAGGLVPAVVQDAVSGNVLMLGYMNQEALDRTRASGWVTFYSRSRRELWTKGDTSGNRLAFVDVRVDCDGDALLVRANPSGPVCHTGQPTCWGPPAVPHGAGFLQHLESVIAQRASADPEASYTRRLLDEGITKVGQKVGEEAVETVIAALAEDDDHLIGEASDLIYHLLVLLKARGLNLDMIGERLRERHAE